MSEVPHRKRSGEAFRDYDSEAKADVREFYRLNHQCQTLDFVQKKRAQFLPLRHARMSVWEAIDRLDSVVDDSDPDTDLTQLEHCLQTAEAIRADGHPRWFILTGLIHDLGKVLCLFDEPQWAVVGDTFPVGCRFDESIVYHEYFTDNPDSQRPEYQSATGIYDRHCGLDNVLMSWGHDEYLYHVVNQWLPDEALWMIRYHSFYPAHTHRAYQHLMNEADHHAMSWVRQFNGYDLYSKDDDPPDVQALQPYYRDLVQEYLPRELQW